MTTTRELAHPTCQLPTGDLLTPVCHACHAGLVVDAGRFEIAHEADCPAGVIA